MNKIHIILLTLILSACSSSSKRPVDNVYYRFPEASILPIQSLNVEVKRPSALGILGNRPMVVQTENNGLVQMSNNFWLESPKVLLQNYLTDIFITNKDKPLLTLNSQILALEKKQDQALLSIKFSMTDSEGLIIFDKTYNKQKRMTNSSIAAFSSATASLLEEMIKQLSIDIQ